MSATIIRPSGVNPHECGYCGSKNPTSTSYGVFSERMNVSDYERLMLQGWRRCGIYFYKPLMHATCCPMYTIRLNVNNFQMSKSQKKVLKNVQKKISDALPTPMLVEESVSASKSAQSEKNPPSTGDSEQVEITVTVERASFTEEKFALYRRYQVAVHRDKEDDVSPRGFTGFLVDSPLTDDLGDGKYGTFHHLYRLHGELIAVGVLDLLPSGLSSVYCFYDNDKRDLVLGKYTALKEIEWCQREGYTYYYMGYYIHDCEKMRYKGEYKPSELLCPTTLQWFDLAASASLLEKHKFTPLDPVLAEERDKVADKDKNALEKFCFDLKSQTEINKIALDIGRDDSLYLNDLSKRGVSIVKPMLEEMATYIEKDICYHILVQLA